MATGSPGLRLGSRAMTQRMDGDRRGLGSPVTPHALVFACNSIVPGVDGLPLPSISPSVWMPAWRGSR
jgi:hypothetical protein